MKSTDFLRFNTRCVALGVRIDTVEVGIDSCWGGPIVTRYFFADFIRARRGEGLEPFKRTCRPRFTLLNDRVQTGVLVRSEAHVP